MAQNKFLDSSGLQYLIDKLKTQFSGNGIPSISFDNIDNIKNLEDAYEGKPLIYAVTKPKTTTDGTVNVFIGILEIISDDMSHLVTQILTTHYTYNTNTKQFDFNSHDDTKINQCYRSYNISAAHLTNERNTWSDWNPFVDATIQTVIGALSKKVNELETKITNLENNTVSLGEDGKIKSSQLPSYLDDVVEFAEIKETVEIQTMSLGTEQPGKVVYVSSVNQFAFSPLSLGEDNAKYYNNWIGRDNYADDKFVPLVGKIFVDSSTDKLYRWNGSTLVEVSSTELEAASIDNNEIDNMFNK
nr:MAG TPA: hypothetical protein [Crassvirales sp.]